MKHRIETSRLTLRLPSTWRDALKEMAEKNRRSVNSEILANLEGVVRASAAEQTSKK